MDHKRKTPIRRGPLHDKAPEAAGLKALICLRIHPDLLIWD